MKKSNFFPKIRIFFPLVAPLCTYCFGRKMFSNLHSSTKLNEQTVYFHVFRGEDFKTVAKILINTGTWSFFW